MMVGFIEWIDEYDLFLFDFDGLLVDTEFLHYRSYQKMCLARGFSLPWDFVQYCDIAHTGSSGLQEGTYKLFPGLYEQEPDWRVLHQEKQRLFLQIVEGEGAPLMPGVEEALQFLKQKGARCCVVTHSPLSLIKAIRNHNPILDAIPHWVSRESYKEPKPSPEPYLTAIELYGKPGDRVIGFEDSIRGWKSLHSAGLQAVVVSSLLEDSKKNSLKQEGAFVYSSFKELLG